MNEIMNKFLLTWNEIMPELHLRQPSALGQPGFMYSACGPFTKTKERIKKFKETRDSQYIYQNELDKLAFNMT